MAGTLTLKENGRVTETQNDYKFADFLFIHIQGYVFSLLSIFVSSVFTGLGCDFRNNTGIDRGHTTVLLGTLRSNDASAMRTSLKK